MLITVVHNMNVCKRVLFFISCLLKQQMLTRCLFCLTVGAKEICTLKLRILFSTFAFSGVDLLNFFFNRIKCCAVILIVVVIIFTNLCFAYFRVRF